MKKLISEIRGDASPELKAKLADLRKEQFELRFRGGSDDRKTSRHREIRRTIARVMTVLGERERADVATGTAGAAAAAKATKAAAAKAGSTPAAATKATTKKAGGKKSGDKKPGDKKQ